jgi:hypothetical protein
LQACALPVSQSGTGSDWRCRPFAAPRDFFRDPQGRTLAGALALWTAAQQSPPAAIERQFQINRHVRDCFAQHPGASCARMLQAWQEKRLTAQAPVFSGLSE